MAAISKFDEANLQALCDILGDTTTGLTGSEIGRYLGECSIDDPMPQMTKRHRLFGALRARQEQDGAGNAVVKFILHVMQPVRHVGNRDYFERRRAELNAALAFSGLSLGEDGKLRQVLTARTLNEAEARAGVLRKALVERKVHADVLKFCRAELVIEFEQRGARRAEYGERLIERLAADLTKRFGRGFSRQNLQQMRAFYTAWPAERIRQTPSGEFREYPILPAPSASLEQDRISESSSRKSFDFPDGGVKPLHGSKPC